MYLLHLTKKMCPIPQTFLDGIYNADGRALTADEKKAIQNPGY
jgi:hypothetical protein